MGKTSIPYEFTLLHTHVESRSYVMPVCISIRCVLWSIPNPKNKFYTIVNEIYYVTSENIFYKLDEPFRNYKTGHKQKPDREYKHKFINGWTLQLN